MYHDLREVIWWDGIKKDIAEFVAKSPNSQHLKAEHQKSSGLLQKIQTPTLKWEDVNTDFVVGLPQTQSQSDSICLIVDRLTKTIHFIPVKSTYLANDYARIYINKIESLNGGRLCKDL